MIRLSIPRVPKSPNRLLQRHWRVVQNDKNDWKTRVGEELLVNYPDYYRSLKSLDFICSGERTPFRSKVSIAVFSPYQEMDPDNLQAARKPILDSCKHNFLIFDDKREWCESTITQHKCKTKKEMRTEILIESL